MYEAMRQRWLADFPDHAWEEVEQAYEAPGRHYHNLTHIRHCLVEYDQVTHLLEDAFAVRAAIWFHDIVYDPRKSDNEEQSAKAAARHLLSLGHPYPWVRSLHQLILDTRHAEIPATPDGQYLVDIDLQILGQDQSWFDQYELAIRREYAHVPDDAFRTGRARILESFLARPRIYYTDYFAAKYEANARANLARSISQLRG